MKQTIWESSSRPLFVKSVWIETEAGHCRHFILDYESQKKYSDLRNVKQKKEIPKISYTSASSDVSDDYDLQLVGSAKTCEVPQGGGILSTKAAKSAQNFRNAASHSNFYDILKKRGIPLRDEQFSKRNSLQDLNGDSSGCDDRLAERVLNWLDLAGKTTYIRPNTAVPAEPIPSAKKSARRDLKSRRELLARAASSAKRPDSIKHITIIFNKEGIPVRYNRPVRFSDLFRNGYNASRKFASNLQAARYNRLPNDQENTTVGNVVNLGSGTGPLPGKSENKPIKGERKKMMSGNSFSYDQEYRKLMNKQILDEACNLQEVKKQLHIFMPSLPKKNVAAPSSDIDGSCLSTVVSEPVKN